MNKLSILSMKTYAIKQKDHIVRSIIETLKS